MKTGKKTIIIMILMCLATICISAVLEFGNMGEEFRNTYHIAYFQNLFLGIFASSFLVLVPAIVQYHIDKSNYYTEILNDCNDVLYYALEIIAFTEEYSEGQERPKCFKHFGQVYSRLVLRYDTFTHFFKLSRKDKLIESIVNETSKFARTQHEMLRAYQDMAAYSGKGQEQDFEEVRRNIVELYKQKFLTYQELVEQYMRNLLKEKTLKTYTDL